MIPLIFIIMVTGLCIYLSYHVTPESEITWFTYYKGGIVGMFVSGLALEFWIKKRKRSDKKKGNR
jgi:hypothetical protein